jgi:hypothetical protein
MRSRDDSSAPAHTALIAQLLSAYRRRAIPLALSLVPLIGFALLPACAKHVAVPSEISACPCATGTVCCASGVCAADESDCVSATSALFEDAQGKWTGYFENFALASGSDAIQISISVAADGTGLGQVVLGKSAPPAAPTNPDLPWPSTNVDEITPILSPDYVEGFSYEAKDLHWESRRLRFTIDRLSAWKGWCELQTSFLLPGGNVPPLYSCAGGIIGGGSNGCTRQDTPPVPVDCYKAIALCSFIGGVCSCDADGCTAASNPVAFDIALRDGLGDGSNSLSGGNIRLTRSRR